MLASFVCLAITSSATVGQRRAATTGTRQASDAKKGLALADFYYKNDDITDKAAVQYRKVRDSYPKSSEAATAQYFLGSYYHRKFYIQKEKKLNEEIGLLTEAQGQYEDYADKYAWNNKSPEWLSDAYFNLALIFLQRGKDREAEQFLGKMYGAAPYDSEVYIYQVVWSPNSKDVIDSKVDARQLAEYTNSLVYDFRNAQQQQQQQNQIQQPRSFGSTVEKIKRWCRGRK